jgi:hypothetical protein
MNAQATQAKQNLLTRASVSTLTAHEFAALLAGELAKIEARPAPKSTAALERHEATIAGYKAAIAELTQPEPTEPTKASEQAIEAPLVAVVAGGKFVGVVSAGSDVQKLAADAGLVDFIVIKSCGLCSSASDVPAAAKVFYKAAWDEVIESDAGHTGKIVWTLA